VIIDELFDGGSSVFHDYIIRHKTRDVKKKNLNFR